MRLIQLPSTEAE